MKKKEPCFPYIFLSKKKSLVVIYNGHCQGLVGLVTGGASGLGRATAEQLLKQGGRVVVCDLPSSPGQETAKQLGENASFVPIDVSMNPTKQARVKSWQHEYVHLGLCRYKNIVLAALDATPMQTSTMTRIDYYF